MKNVVAGDGHTDLVCKVTFVNKLKAAEEHGRMTGRYPKEPAQVNVVVGLAERLIAARNRMRPALKGEVIEDGGFDVEPTRAPAFRAFLRHRSTMLFLRQADFVALRPGAIADQTRTIRVPGHMIELIDNVVRTSRALVQELPRAAS